MKISVLLRRTGRIATSLILVVGVVMASRMRAQGGEDSYPLKSIARVRVSSDLCYGRLNQEIDNYISKPGNSEVEGSLYELAKKCSDPRVYGRVQFAVRTGDLRALAQQKK